MNITITPEAATAIAGIATIATGVTKKLMVWTPDAFDGPRWAQLVSLVSCIIASVLWLALLPGGTWQWVVARGFLAWAGSELLHNTINTTKAHKDHVAGRKED